MFRSKIQLLIVIFITCYAIHSFVTSYNLRASDSFLDMWQMQLNPHPHYTLSNPTLFLLSTQREPQSAFASYISLSSMSHCVARFRERLSHRSCLHHTCSFSVTFWNLVTLMCVTVAPSLQLPFRVHRVMYRFFLFAYFVGGRLGFLQCFSVTESSHVRSGASAYTVCLWL